MTDTELQQIESYLNGNLAGKTLQNFELRLKQDQAFYQDVLAHKQVNDTLQNKSLTDFMEVLQIVEEEFYAEKSTERTYSLEQLLAMFAKVEDYENELAVTHTRSNRQKTFVINAENGEIMSYVSPSKIGLGGSLGTSMKSSKHQMKKVTFVVKNSLVTVSRRESSHLHDTPPRPCSTLSQSFVFLISAIGARVGSPPTRDNRVRWHPSTH